MEKATDIGIILCCKDSNFPLDSGNCCENMLLIMLRTLEHTFSSQKNGQITSLCDESQFDAEL